MADQRSPLPASDRPSQDEERRRLSERLRVILLALLVTTPITAALGWWLDNGQALGTSLSGLAVSAAAYGLNRALRVHAAIFLLLLGMLVATTASMIVGESVHDSGMILYPTMIVIGSLLLSPRANRVLVSLVVLSVTLVWWMGYTGRSAPEFQGITDTVDLVAILVVLVVQAIAVNILAQGLYRSLREARAENAERRAAEAEVRRLNAELEERVETRTAELAAANADLESFSYSVSHDLRSPLRVASNYAGILDQDYSTDWDPEARHLLERIRASNARMNLLIDELLRFSRLGRQAVDRQAVDMRALVRRVVDQLVAENPAQQAQWTIGDLPPVEADPVLIEQVVSNLLGNALKYSSGSDRPRIEIGFDDDGSGPSYFVRDNGIGFDPSQAGRLFAVFERLHSDDEFEGTGIGLATVQRILQRHGGRIWAEGIPGEGAVFRFQLPSGTDGPAPGGAAGPGQAGSG